MSVDVLLDRLHNVKAIRPGQWVAGCPICQSRNGRPIAIKEGEDARLLVHPFCGCGTDDVLRAIGLRMGDLFPRRLGHHLAPVGRGFSAEAVLIALQHELTVAELIASDVEQSGEYAPAQRERMALVSQRVTEGVIALGFERALAAVRKMRSAA